jgi:hypothetical protein
MPADLVFLINQASESLTARQLKIALTNWPSSDPPAIVSLNSQTDQANSKIWPIGMKLATFFGLGGKKRAYQNPPGDEQRTYYTQTTGQDSRQITHRLVPANAPVKIMGGETGDALLKIPLKVADHTEDWELRVAKGNDDTTFVLYSNAYWVVSLPKAILDGHSGLDEDGGIFNPAMTEVMHRLVRYSLPVGAAPKSAPRPATAEEVQHTLSENPVRQRNRQSLQVPATELDRARLKH